MRISKIYCYLIRILKISDKFQYSNRKEFIKRLVDDDVIEIVNIEEADEDVSLTYPKEDRDD